MSTIAYHLAELETARTSTDARHLMPELPESYDSLLDLGCGAGQTIIAARLKPGAFVCGIDIDEDALAMGRTLSPGTLFLRAAGETIPFPDHSFDVVISRVALPYMHMPEALGEIARVLKPGGHAWFSLHPLSMVLRATHRVVKARNLKGLIYQLYVLANGAFFHLLGRQFRYPLNRARCESFQTTEGMKKAMRRAGFEQVEIERGKFFVVKAVKPGPRQR